MIEENKINKNKTIDALPIPEDAVILKSKKSLIQVNWLYWE